MTVWPRWVRRPLMVGLVLGLALLLSLAPLVLLGVAVLSPLLPGRWRALRLLAFLLVYLMMELVALAVAVVAWYLSGFGWQLRGPTWTAVHYAVLRRLLHALVLAAKWLFRLRLRTDGLGWSPLDDGIPGSENAMLVLARHAGPGDSFLLVSTLMDRDHRRRPRIVLKDTLQLDPVVDVYLNRLPSAWISPGRSGPSAVGRLAHGLGNEDALLIFPEGGNFTPGRRRRAIDRLRRKGLVEEADQAERMRNLLPPKPGGVLAALAAAPHADVVFVAHTGLEHMASAADVWRGLPMGSEVLMRWDFVPAGDVPDGADAQADWLFERWSEMDGWLEAHRRV